ncbi:30S ribosomal protein S13, partial [Candidatus Woesearchaeota archaeon]|nr:30S ribosomal protein S13 [Candidatus Woesearchaeota archaeon]
IRGVGVMFAHAACKILGIDGAQRLGAIPEADIRKLDDVIVNPAKYPLPAWMLNRRFDPETGIDKHLVAGDLQFAQENDIKFMKRIKSYKGIRHMQGAPVRGQRTRSNFRKNKGQVLGVKVRPGAKSGRT